MSEKPVGKSNLSTEHVFSDPSTIAGYATATPGRVPGFADLHRMSMILLAERAPEAAEILVVGAGGGLELRAFADAQLDWRFVGVDPSEEMLRLAREILGPRMARVELTQGYVDSAPPGPFDGATCLLTLHFLAPDERLHTLREIRRRLKPGAPLIVAHHSAAEGATIERWLSRSVAFASGPDLDFGRAAASAHMMASSLPVLSTDEEEAMLRAAGFCDVALFYAGFSFRGWVAAASPDE